MRSSRNGCLRNRNCEYKDSCMPNEKYIIMYSTPEGDVRVQAIVKDETIWLTQRGIATLFDVGVPAVSKHLKHIFEEGELRETSVVSKMEITTQHGFMEQSVDNDAQSCNSHAANERQLHS